MSNEQSSIHDFDFGLICEYFSGLERQGPGSPEVTLKALSFIDHLTHDSCIADIGCGTGGQTMVMAHQVPGHVTGIDLFPAFTDLFNSNARKHQLAGRVEGITGSMEDLPFGNESLDLIWCEGAIYNMGYQRGLREWRRFLKTGGYIAVSEASWFTAERPEEINAFWQDAYPEIDTIPRKVEQMQQAGYVPVAHFILPENCWTEHFYVHQVRLQEEFLKKHPGNKTAIDLVANQRMEAQLYETYKQYYGYAFYIGKKV